MTRAQRKMCLPCAMLLAASLLCSKAFVPPPSVQPPRLLALRSARSSASSGPSSAGGLARYASSSGAGGTEQEETGTNPLVLFVGGVFLLWLVGVSYEGVWGCFAKDSKMDTPDRYIPACSQLYTGLLIAEVGLNAYLFFNQVPAAPAPTEAEAAEAAKRQADLLQATAPLADLVFMSTTGEKLPPVS
eukprot:TRINITY_DN112654_c0_g1_i1.p1 TRINITY_DN112654_c0_g1~~TRINITY_DN112654_c0_g1_i1.p1  ORF type:complete len:188 (+),score=33.03 TRINITY_DN112654_c0_g1_i1:67-630(+)